MSELSSRPLLFVVGMHRSGTSALCAALAAAGAGFGDHLLQAVEGVNDEGFWEDQALVELNEALLAERGYHWFTAIDWPADDRWEGELPERLLQRVDDFLRSATDGDETLRAVKDPRLCLTLPLWLQRCAALDIATHCCLIERDPVEVAASLERRDGLPLDYGLRLASAYASAAAASLPPDTPRLSYDGLLDDPAGTIARLAAAGLPLDPGEPAVASSVRRDLRHQQGDSQEPPASAGEVVLLKKLAEVLVERGRALSELGTMHSQALDTVAQRDADIEKLGGELRRAVATVAERDAQIAEFDRRLDELGQMHGTALATIDERDAQITEFDRRLDELGQMHSKALAHIEELDKHVAELVAMRAQLERVFETPVMGRVFRRMWARAED